MPYFTLEGGHSPAISETQKANTDPFCVSVRATESISVVSLQLFSPLQPEVHNILVSLSVCDHTEGRLGSKKKKKSPPKPQYILMSLTERKWYNYIFVIFEETGRLCFLSSFWKDGLLLVDK